MQERRSIDRRLGERSIHYFVTVLEAKDLKKISLKGDMVDISNAGIGIRTDYPLERGHVLTFYEGIGHQAGIVEWSSAVRNSGYRVGIRFL